MVEVAALFLNGNLAHILRLQWQPMLTRYFPGSDKVGDAVTAKYGALPSGLLETDQMDQG